MKKLHLALTALVLLGIVEARAATAISAETLVNTYSLTVRTQTDPLGVKVVIDPVIEGFTYTVTRDGTEIKRLTTADLGGGVMFVNVSFLDPNAVYGKTHTYRVTVSGTKQSASATGTRGSTDIVPAVEEVRTLRVWLDDAGPYNVYVKFNQYDSARYRLTKVSFSVGGKSGSVGISEAESKANCGMIVEFDLRKKTSIPYLTEHGPHEVICKCHYKQVNESKELPSAEVKATATVFFDKYGGGGKKPNWLSHWKGLCGLGTKQEVETVIRTPLFLFFA